MATFLKESYFSGTNGSHFKQSLYYTLSQNVSKNTSTITYYGYVGSVDNYSGSGVTATVYINNSAVGTFTSLPARSSGTLRGTKTVTVTHNADGTKSVSYSMRTDTSWSLGDSSLSGTLTLPRINRKATISSAPNFTDEDNPTIKYSNPAGNNVSSLSACISLTGARDDVPYRSISKTGSSYTFNLTADERNTLRNACTTSNSRKVYFYVKTVIGGTTLTSSVAKTLTIVNANPVFSDFEFEDINPTTLALTGDSSVNVNGFSNIQITIPELNKAEAVKSATMSKYRCTIGETSYDVTYKDDDDVSTIINNASNGTYNVYAIDSRNNSTLVTKLASSEIAYQPIYIDKQSSKIERDDNQVGDGAILTLSGTFWNGDFGDVNNSLSVSYKLKKSNSDTWINGTTTITPTITDNSFSFTGQIASDNLDTSWDLADSYDVKIIIEDELSIAEYIMILNSAVPTMSFDKDGVGIMCAYDSSLGGSLQVNGEVLDNTDVYDESETKTNKVWIDNKPIYRKVYEKQVSSNTTDSSIALLSDLGYETIWINQGKSFCQYGANTSSGINWYNGSSDYGLVYINPTGKLTIKNGSGLSRTYYVTVEYTKSTS